ncbi:hypothetical protein EGW08_005400 [Elysia chlorotica]|uniref:CCHC-type domain-containing protein n=1 Tax=Elysia chlorotica TaxID=188477 RepID=A0A3S1BF52_ELYCH|nr:hypothetical protein EGW08_005400 [Elysia chlorotica]
MAEAAQFSFIYEAVLTTMATAARSSAVHPPSTPAPSAEIQLVLQLLRSLIERMERLERQGSLQPGQTERPEGRRRRRRGRRTGRSQMRCHRCQQPGHFARECRAPAPVGSTGSVERREAELGEKGVPVLADKGVEVSTVRQDLDADPGSSSSTTHPPTLLNGPAAPEPAVLPPERTVRAGNVVPTVASVGRRRTPQLPEVNRHVPSQPAVPPQGQTLHVINEVSPVVWRPRRMPMQLPLGRQDSKPVVLPKEQTCRTVNELVLRPRRSASKLPAGRDYNERWASRTF